MSANDKPWTPRQAEALNTASRLFLAYDLATRKRMLTALIGAVMLSPEPSEPGTISGKPKRRDGYRWCGQCGNFSDANACGPTHAAVYREDANAKARRVRQQLAPKPPRRRKARRRSVDLGHTGYDS